MIEDDQNETTAASGDATPAEKSLPQQAVEGYMSIKEYAKELDAINHSDEPPAHEASGDDTKADAGDSGDAGDAGDAGDSGGDDSGE